jgi:hypothetical protein
VIFRSVRTVQILKKNIIDKQHGIGNWIELCLENITKYKGTIGKPEGFDLIQHYLDGDLNLNLYLNSRKIINSLKVRL